MFAASFQSSSLRKALELFPESLIQAFLARLWAYPSWAGQVGRVGDDRRIGMRRAKVFCLQAFGFKLLPLPTKTANQIHHRVLILAIGQPHKFHPGRLITGLSGG